MTSTMIAGEMNVLDRWIGSSRLAAMLSVFFVLSLPRPSRADNLGAIGKGVNVSSR